MNNHYITKISEELKDNYLFCILFFGLIISIIKINFLPFSLTIDSYGYLNYADNLLTRNDWQSRPIGYPFFLKITRFFETFGFILVIFFQIFLYILSSAIIYLIFRKFNRNISFIFSLLFLLTPAFQWINYNLLADSIYSFMPIIVIFFICRYFANKNIINLIMIFILALIIALLRPTYVVFFYVMPIVTLFYTFWVTKHSDLIITKRFFFITVILSLLSIFIFNNSGSQYSKNYGVHQLWIWNISTSMCGDQKCFNLNNGRHAEKYFKVVSEIIEKDDYFKEVLSSNYDYKDSPESINEELIKLQPKKLLEKIHISEKHTPFVHIYGFMVNNIGFQETHKIIKNLTLETFIKNPIILINSLKKIYHYDFIFNRNLKKSHGFKEGMYFAIIPKPYLSLSEQGMTFFQKITVKEYAQIIYSLERFTGKTIKKYNKNQDSFNNLHNKIDDLDFALDKFYSDKNYAFIIFYLLGYINLYFLIFYKIFILFVVPIYSTFLILNKIIFRRGSLDSYLYILSLSLFYSIFLVSSIMSPNSINKAINLNLSIFYPILIILFIHIFKLPKTQK